MSSPEIERFKTGFEAFSRGDLETAFQYIAPDFELLDHVIIEDTSGQSGPEAFVENRGRLLEAFENVTYEPLEFVEFDGGMLVRVHATARNARTTGMDLELEVGHVWTIRDGLGVRLEIFPTWTQAREAAGLEA